MAVCLSQELVEHYVAGVCSEDQTRTIEEHLSRCENCRRRTQSARTNMSADKFLDSDGDGSGEVNLVDFAIFSSYWLQSGCIFPTWCGGADMNPFFNDRDQVNVVDLDIFAQHWLEVDCSGSGG